MSLFTNYRPIIIINSMTRTFEIIICEYLEFSLNLKLYDSEQGFCQGKSVTTTKVYCTRSRYDAIYIDLGMAFNSVYHNILLKKHSIIGISKSFVNWFKNYLIYRISRIKLVNFISEKATIKVGYIKVRL